MDNVSEKYINLIVWKKKHDFLCQFRPIFWTKTFLLKKYILLGKIFYLITHKRFIFEESYISYGKRQKSCTLIFIYFKSLCLTSPIFNSSSKPNRIFLLQRGIFVDICLRIFHWEKYTYNLITVLFPLGGKGSMHKSNLIFFTLILVPFLFGIVYA